MTGAEAIVKFLLNESVRHVFGLLGSPMMPIADAIYRLKGIDFVASQHEQGSIYLAGGYAKYTREPSVCLVTVGPGATNAATGLAEAYVESVPVIFMSMESPTRLYGKSFCNAHEIDQMSMFKPIAKACLKIERVDRVTEILERAFRTATTGRPGPVYVGIARDILDKEIEIELHPPRAYRPVGRALPGPNEISEAAAILAASKNPMILAGGGVWWAAAQNEIISLAEMIEAFICTTYSHAGLIPQDHPLSVGLSEYQYHRRDNTVYNAVIKDVDVLLAVGVTFSDRTTSNYHPSLVPSHLKIVQIDIDPSEIGKNYPVILGMVGDAKAALEGIIRVLEEKGWKRKGVELAERARWVQGLKREERAKWHAKAISSARPIKRLRLVKDVFDFFGPKAIISGSHGWRERVADLSQPALGDGGDFGTALGSGFCRSMAVKLVSPELAVVWLGGDGAFMMVLSELATAVAYKIPVIAVINHNSAYGNEKFSQWTRYQGRFIGTDLPIPDLAAVAQAFGAYGERVEDPDQIKPALERAVAAHRPAVIDVILDNSIEELDPSPVRRS